MTEQFAAAELALRDALDELAGLYFVRLTTPSTRCMPCARRKGARRGRRHAALADARRDGPATRRAVPRRVRALYGEAYDDRARAGERAGARTARRSRAPAGSPVRSSSPADTWRMLLRTLQLFAVRPPADLPVVAWSAGAMALTERVVLFHDYAAAACRSRGLGRGLARVPGWSPCPTPAAGCASTTRVRMGLLARRFARRPLRGARRRRPGRRWAATARCRPARGYPRRTVGVVEARHDDAHATGPGHAPGRLAINRLRDRRRSTRRRSTASSRGTAPRSSRGRGARSSTAARPTR